MPLAPVAIALTFEGGINTKIDSKSVPTTQLLVLENGEFSGATTIAKRNGYDALSKAVDSGGEYAAPRALAARGDELCLLTATDLLSYRESSASWSRVGPCASIVHTERAIAATGTDQSMPDMATAGGVTVAAWEDSRGGIWWSVVEQASQRVLRPAEQLAVGATCPRVVHVGDRILIFWLDPTGGRIMVAVVEPATYLAAVTAIVVTADLNTTFPFYDAVRIGAMTGDPALLAWNITTGDGFRVGYVDASGTLQASPAVATFANVSEGPISVAWIDATTVYGGLGVGVAFTDAGDVFAQIMDAALLTSVDAGPTLVSDGGTPIRIASAFTTDGSVTDGMQTSVTLVTWAEIAGASDRDARVIVGSLSSSTGAGPTAVILGHGLVSRGFVDGIDTETGILDVASGPCVVVTHEVDFFPYCALTRWSALATAPVYACVGRLVVGSSDGLPVRGHLATVEQDADDARIWRVPLLARQQVPIEPPAPLTAFVPQFTETGIQIVTLDFDSPEAHQSAEFGRDLIIAGACPMRYDGDTIAELGFHTAPDGTIPAVASAGGSLTPSVTYQYFLSYEERDAAGEIHPGAMSLPVLVAMGATGTRVTLTIPTYRLTSKRRVSIAVWRSAGNDQSDDPLMYRVSSLDPSATGSNGYVLNNTNADTVTFVDDLADVSLPPKERAYTNSGVLSNDPIGLGHIVCAGKDRLFFSDPTDGGIVRFSQARRDGYGVEVPEGLSIRAADVAITAIGILDDAVLAFASESISFFAGPGPLPNPEAAPQIGFSPAAIVTGDVGCVSAKSLALTADRVLFKSSRGIYQIDRARQVGYVGAMVEGFNAQRIVSADAVPGKTQIIFLTDESGGRSLLYDYYYGQWSEWTNHDGLDAVVVGGVYHYLRANPADARVFKASSTSYLDGTNEIRLHIETAWVKLLGYHQGLQKIWRAYFLGEYKSAHKLRVRIATDYRPGFDEHTDLDVDANYAPAPYGEGLYGAGPYGGDSDSVYQRQWHLDVKCQAIRFSIEDVTSGTTLGASFELTELLLEGGAVKRTANISAARSS